MKNEEQKQNGYWNSTYYIRKLLQYFFVYPGQIQKRNLVKCKEP